MQIVFSIEIPLGEKNEIDYAFPFILRKGKRCEQNDGHSAYGAQQRANQSI